MHQNNSTHDLREYRRLSGKAKWTKAYRERAIKSENMHRLHRATNLLYTLEERRNRIMMGNIASYGK